MIAFWRMRGIPNPRLNVKGGMDNPDLGSNGEAAIVEDAWKGFLNVDCVDPDDDFFLLGGNSLLAIRMLVAVSGRLGHELDYEGFFAVPTFGTLRHLAMTARNQ